MRIGVVALVVGALMAGSMATADSAAAGWRMKECRFRGLNGSPDWSDREERRTAGCLAEKFGVSASTTKYVISRESGWYRLAVNASSGASGLMQHIRPYFCSRLETAKRMRPALKPYGPQCNWANPRQNIAAGMALALTGGWGHWTVLG